MAIVTKTHPQLDGFFYGEIIHTQLDKEDDVHLKVMSRAAILIPGNLPSLKM